MKKAGKGPYLVLMNHSSFFDLNVTFRLMPRPFYIVSTADALIGKEWILRKVGCLPTTKFTPDVTLTRNLMRALHEKKTNVLLPQGGSMSKYGVPPFVFPRVSLGEKFSPLLRRKSSAKRPI